MFKEAHMTEGLGRAAFLQKLYMLIERLKVNPTTRRDATLSVTIALARKTFNFHDLPRMY